MSRTTGRPTAPDPATAGTRSGPAPGPAAARPAGTRGLAVALTATLSLWTPGAASQSALAAQLRSPDARAFNGTKAVGALFVDQKGKLTHFCTASVVSSKAGNLLLTAAHCMEGRSLTPAGSVVFAPELPRRQVPAGHLRGPAGLHRRRVAEEPRPR